MPAHDWTRVDAGLFHSFRLGWTCAICDALNLGGLPSDYFAMAEAPIRDLTPDVLTSALESGLRGSEGGITGLAVAQAPPRARFVRTIERDLLGRRADRITVRHRHGQIVAVIEIVSPGNKGSKAEFRNFLEKVVDLIRQGVHVLVIDVFPPTPRDPDGVHKAIWDEFGDQDETPPLDEPLTVASYSAGAIQTAYVEPFAVGDELPEMPLFLETEIYVPVRLEDSYRTSWSAFPGALKGLLEPEAARGD